MASRRRAGPDHVGLDRVAGRHRSMRRSAGLRRRPTRSLAPRSAARRAATVRRAPPRSAAPRSAARRARHLGVPVVRPGGRRPGASTGGPTGARLERGAAGPVDGRQHSADAGAARSGAPERSPGRTPGSSAWPAGWRRDRRPGPASSPQAVPGSGPRGARAHGDAPGLGADSSVGGPGVGDPDLDDAAGAALVDGGHQVSDGGGSLGRDPSPDDTARSGFDRLNR